MWPTLLLSQVEAGKVRLSGLEMACYMADERRLLLYETAPVVERTRFYLLKQTRMLVAALRCIQAACGGSGTQKFQAHGSGYPRVFCYWSLFMSVNLGDSEVLCSPGIVNGSGSC
jgi:hypothetical protein